jgi:hypothetical protein
VQLDRAEKAAEDKEKDRKVLHIEIADSASRDFLNWAQDILVKGNITNRPEEQFIIDYRSKLNEIKEKNSDPLWLPILWTDESRNEAMVWVSTTAESLIIECSREKRNRNASIRQPVPIWKASALAAVLCKLEDFWEHFDFERRASLSKKLRQVRSEFS